MADASHELKYIRPDAPLPPQSLRRGVRSEAWTPATLDLAERARLAVNGMVEPTDPEADYRVYWKASFRFNPPVMYHDGSDTGITLKFLEATPRLRIMSGSEQGIHVEDRWREVLMRMIGPDGQVASPVNGPGLIRPDIPGGLEGDQMIDQQVNGIALGVASTLAVLDDRSFWEPIGRDIVDGLGRLSVPYKEDMAYIPQWVFAPGQRGDPAQPRPLGTFAAYATWPGRRLIDFYRVSGYQPSLDLAGKICRYIVREGQYFDANYRFLPDNPDPSGPRHDVVHFHHHAMTILTCLEYALASGDQEILDFAAQAFPIAIQHGEPITGFFPESVIDHHQSCELCEVGDMVRIAVRQAEAGLGDHYWDDADHWTRNQLAEGQLTRADWIYRLHLGQPPSQIDRDSSARWPMTTERVGERNIGAYAGWQAPNDWVDFMLTRFLEGTPFGDRLGHVQGIMHCCTANAVRGLYEVWRGIVGTNGDRVNVNLLLNRTHGAVDVDSHIPYNGQVDLHVKRDCRLAVRMPAWVDLGQVSCFVDDSAREIAFDGRYAQVGDVRGKQSVRLNFPIGERTDRVTINNRWYLLVRKGHDIVYIDPPGKLCPLYQRDHYRDNVTLWKKTTRYMDEQTLDW
ncbi:MAG: hypothetical protein OXH98_17745 [Caldilineaceae bacterium]|nr:hypothetical protein [Caldilineaceae bacterium]